MPPISSLKISCSCFFDPAQKSPCAEHSLFSSSLCRSLNGFRPPFLLFFPAGPCNTFFKCSNRPWCGLLRETARSLHFLASPLQLAHPAFPPFCSPASNSCCGPSPWKNRITSMIWTPFDVRTASLRLCKQAFLSAIQPQRLHTFLVCKHEVSPLHQCSLCLWP